MVIVKIATNNCVSLIEVDMTFEEEDTIRNIIRDELQSSYNYDNAIAELRNQLNSLESKLSSYPQRYELDSGISGIKNDLDNLKTSMRHGMPIF